MARWGWSRSAGWPAATRSSPTATIPPTSSSTRTPGGRGFPRRSRRMRCWSSRCSPAAIPPAYGRASGGIINTVTRSGSNTPYGTAYWFFRNRGLNAQGSVRRHQSRRSTAIRPAPAWAENSYRTSCSTFSTPRFTGAIFRWWPRSPARRCSTARERSSAPARPAPAQCAAALQFLNRQFQVLDRSADSELVFGKLDWLPSQSHHISASFNYLRWRSPNGFQTQAVVNDGSGVGANGNSSVRTRYGRLEWMYIPDGARINEFRFGWFKDRHADNLNPNLIPRHRAGADRSWRGRPTWGSARTCRASTPARTGSRLPTA